MSDQEQWEREHALMHAGTRGILVRLESVINAWLEWKEDKSSQHLDTWNLRMEELVETMRFFINTYFEATGKDPLGSDHQP